MQHKLAATQCYLTMQDSISFELLQQIRELGPDLHRAVAAASEVDCLVALALSASQYNLHPPKLTSDNVILIKEGWTAFACKSACHLGPASHAYP